MPDTQVVRDVVIIGAGPAGLSAAMVLARSKRDVLLLDEGKQRNLKSHGLHNFITRDGILPPDFLQLAREQLSSYDVACHKAEITEVKKVRNGFVTIDKKGNNYQSRFLLLATGVCDHIPDIPGMKELWGKCIFHCPFCDGYECRDSHVGLYAKRYNGYGMALALKHLSNQVTLFTDGAFYLRNWQRENLAKKGINIITRKIIRLEHDDSLKGIVLNNGSTVPCNSLFTHHGFQVNRTLLDQLGCMVTKKGAAITNRHQQTSVPGVYVAGDASYDMHFVIVASAEGVKAGVTIHEQLLKKENELLNG